MGPGRRGARPIRERSTKRPARLVLESHQCDARGLVEAGYGSRMKLPESCGTGASHAPRNVTLGEPGVLRSCPIFAQQLSASCPTVAPRAEIRPNFGRIWLTSTNGGTISGHIRPNSAKTRSKSGQQAAKIGRVWSNLGNFGRLWAEDWPSLVGVWLAFGPI